MSMTNDPQQPNNPFPRPSRREFIAQTGFGLSVIVSGGLSIESCASEQSLRHIKGSIVGANHKTGHLLRTLPHSSQPVTGTPAYTVGVLIIGGGIAGLSARRWLHRQGVTDCLLLEMDHQVGGNSLSGKQAETAYPWGAHYLPIPDIRNRDLLDFLVETGSITGFDERQLPIYNEYHLCHDPEERLFINGFWQEGLVPSVGVPANEQQQINRFFDQVEALKKAKGTDDRDAFAIPLDHSSADDQYRSLDKLSFEQYLTEQGYTSPYLRWYLNYACKDDYGATLQTTSAWAGLHYFASRKGQAANAPSSAVLTWPEGNSFLMEHLKKQTSSPILTNTLALSIADQGNGLLVTAYDTIHQKLFTIQARKMVLATPQYISSRLLHSLNPDRIWPADTFQYSPWVVANLTVSGLPQGRGMSLCWDNVFYGSESVGYILANHQQLSRPGPQQVITIYWPLTQHTPDVARQQAYQTTYEQWLRQILDELEKAHPGVTAYVSQADIWVWGHGMIAPTPGFIWGSARQQATQPIADKVFFAHSDRSGISIFEEAFYQGIRAAKAIKTALQNPILFFLPLFFLLGCRVTPSLPWPKQVGSPVSGTSFYQQAVAMKWKQRDSLAVSVMLAGNLPVFLKKFRPVYLSLADSGHVLIKATIYVAPDYVAIGTDEDWARIPLTPMAAQQIADRLQCFLPTRKLVDSIYRAAAVKLEPVPMYAFRDSTVTMWHHHLIIEGQRKGQKGLIAGIKKDVVISGKISRDARPNREAIYGWHKLDGKPIQPLYTGHINWWVDYSHGIRLIYRKIKVNGKWLDYEDLLKDSTLRHLLCDEPDCDFTRYKY